MALLLGFGKIKFLVKTILVSIRKEKEAFLKTQHPEFSRLFQRLVNDFYMEIKWDFHTWSQFAYLVIQIHFLIKYSSIRFEVDALRHLQNL